MRIDPSHSFPAEPGRREFLEEQCEERFIRVEDLAISSFCSPRNENTVFLSGGQRPKSKDPRAY